jgi:hypothetical protein
MNINPYFFLLNELIPAFFGSPRGFELRPIVFDQWAAFCYSGKIVGEKVIVIINDFYNLLKSSKILFDLCSR